MRNIICKIFLLIVTLLVGILPVPSRAGDVVAIQSAGLSAYTSALLGFENVLLQEVPARGPKSILAHSITSYILSEAENPGQLRNTVINKHPDLLLVIGSSSLSLVKNITDIPIVYLMVPYPEMLITSQDNITGINMNVSAAQQLEALIQAIPATKNVGLLYDPDQTDKIVQEAQDFARQNNISLIALPVKDSREVPAQLARLVGRIDSFWMLPDRTVLTPQTVDYIFLFSLENRTPLLTFSDKYLDMGAVLSVSFDTFDMGKQAGEMALKLLNNAKVSDLPPEPVRKVVVHTNDTAVKTLGIVVEQPDKQE